MYVAGAVSLMPKHAKNASLRAPKGRGNPYPCMCAFGTHTLFRAVSLFTGHRERIATPVCGLVRDDACSFVYRCLVRHPPFSANNGKFRFVVLSIDRNRRAESRLRRTLSGLNSSEIDAISIKLWAILGDKEQIFAILQHLPQCFLCG